CSLPSFSQAAFEAVFVANHVAGSNLSLGRPQRVQLDHHPCRSSTARAGKRIAYICDTGATSLPRPSLRQSKVLAPFARKDRARRRRVLTVPSGSPSFNEISGSGI